MLSGQQALIVTFICPSAEWSTRCTPSSLTDFWRINTWLLHGIDSTLCGFLTVFPCLFFRSLLLSECLCTRGIPESFSACIRLWIQYSWYTCHFTGRTSSELFCCLRQCYIFLPTTKVLQSVSYFPLTEIIYYCKYLLQFILLVCGKDNSVWSLLPSLLLLLLLNDLAE